MLTVYVSLVIAGVIVLGISLLLGGDHEVDHDIDFDHEVDHDIGGGHDLEGGEMGPSKFGIKLIMAFLIGFGFGGVLGLKVLGLAGNRSLLLAIPFAFLFYYCAYKILKWIYNQEITSHIFSKQMVGNSGIVATAIKPGGTGEIKVKDTRTGKEEYFMAKGKDESETFPKGSTITVTGQVAGIFEVEKMK